MSDLIANPFVKRVHPWELVEDSGWPWGLWYHDYCSHEIVMLPIPFNIIFRLGRKFYFCMVRGCHIKIEEEKQDV